jgi:hypothetical protein
MKYCSKCKQEKDESEFFKNKTTKDGLQWQCKLCKNEYKRNSKESNRKGYLKYYYSHKKEKRLSNHIWRTKQRKENIKYKLAERLRERLREVLNGKNKSGSAVRDLGCTIKELKIYLESKFQQGMSWNNYGSLPGCWSIDHIKPISKFDLTNREQLLIVCHYTNLQPLWVEENSRKGNR